jgi:hypothetical protein
MRCLLFVMSLVPGVVCGAAPRALPEGQLPADHRLGDLQNLNGTFPMQAVQRATDWPARQAEIRRRILLSQGLWPLPSRPPLNAVVHGRVERDDYVVDRVYFESIPGHFVTGSLYRPKTGSGPFPAILCPHGHWADGRFHDHGERQIRQELASGGERFEVGGRHPVTARCVQLARMGCLVFLYDMTGYADSIQLVHRPDVSAHLDRPADWGFFSAQAELWLQNMMGLQTWNSIRAIDFVLELPDVDPARIGVTGASGGGTQSMILAAIDERIAAAMPCVMVSTSMQGGCSCENAPYLRIDQGNIDIAAATAPRPLGLTAADDWTIELQTKGYPDLQHLYQLLDKPARLTAAFHTHFKHNYNHVNRTVMYGFFNRHLGMGLDEPVLERDYVPLARAEATVWTQAHPAPSGDAVGDPHEVELLRLATEDARAQIAALVPSRAEALAEYRRVIGGAWETILGRSLTEVGDCSYTESGRQERDGYVESVGVVDHRREGAREQLPVLRLHPQDRWNGEILLWCTDTGKSGVLDGEAPQPIVRRLLEAGFSIAAPDLSGQGEFTADGRSVTSQPMWYQGRGEAGWHRYAGYTYGYNHPLFVKRVHDVLTMVKLAQTHELSPRRIHLVGLGGTAGPVVIAARTQSGDAVARTFVDTREFRFAQLARQDDPMFVPGAVKYLDLEGLMSLCAPFELHVSGEGPLPLATRVYTAAGAESALKPHRLRMEFGELMIRALTSSP